MSGLTFDDGIVTEIFDVPSQSFNTHLSDENNSRIVFSGRFGTGKTTFLKHFFDGNTQDYNVIHLYPVNYSIGNTEDIYRFIKFDILYELMLNEDFEFEENDFSFLKTAPQFILNNLSSLLAPILLTIPDVGKTGFTLYEKYADLYKKFKSFHKSINKGEEDELTAFMHDEIQREGSIHEENIITELICNVLNRIRKKTGKRLVLILDDLDRVDPAHIFRLFNVFSAHIDILDEKDNKFGFDHIVFVCDIVNIRNIYSSQYGSDVDFSGYIDKFFSNEVFHFDSRKNVLAITNAIVESWEYEADYQNLTDFLNNNKNLKDTLKFVVKHLVMADEINLRALFKFRKGKFKINGRAVPFPVNSNIQNWQLLHVLVLEALARVLGDSNILNGVLNRLKEHELIESDSKIATYLIGDLSLILTFRLHNFNESKNGQELKHYLDNEQSRFVRFVVSQDASKRTYYAQSTKIQNVTGHTFPGEKYYFVLLERVSQLLVNMGYL